MNKAISILNKRKSEIKKEFQRMPKDIDQYIAEVASALQEEERQIDQALLVLSNVVGQSEQFYCDGQENNKDRCETQCLGCAGMQEFRYEPLHPLVVNVLRI